MQILADSFPSETADDDTTELEQSARKLVLAYPEDLEEELVIELVHFASLIKGILNDNVIPTSKTFEIDI